MLGADIIKFSCTLHLKKSLWQTDLPFSTASYKEVGDELCYTETDCLRFRNQCGGESNYLRRTQ